MQSLQNKLALTEASNEDFTKRLDALRAVYEKRLEEKEEEHQSKIAKIQRRLDEAKATLATKKDAESRAISRQTKAKAGYL